MTPKLIWPKPMSAAIVLDSTPGKPALKVPREIPMPPFRSQGVRNGGEGEREGATRVHPTRREACPNKLRDADSAGPLAFPSP